MCFENIKINNILHMYSQFIFRGVQTYPNRHLKAYAKTIKNCLDCIEFFFKSFISIKFILCIKLNLNSLIFLVITKHLVSYTYISRYDHRYKRALLLKKYFDVFPRYTLFFVRGYFFYYLNVRIHICVLNY